MNQARDQSQARDDITRAAHQWRVRMNGLPLSDADQAAFQAWLNADHRHEGAYDRAVTIWAAFDALEPSDIAEDLMRPTILERVRRWSGGLATTPRTNAWKIGAVLAALAIVVLPLGIVLETQRASRAAIQSMSVNTYSSERDLATEITLADGTTVVLGPKTTIETTMTSSSRKVVLTKGAALFDVEHDPARPFAVNADDLTAIAIGTRFDVRNNGGVARVAVSEGRVRVSYPFRIGEQGASILEREFLSAGEEIAATKNEGLRDVREIAPEKVGLWTESALVYHGATLSELIADANRYYDGSITFAGDGSQIAAVTVTASFKGDEIDKMLDLVALSFPLEIDRSAPGDVIVRAKTSFLESSQSPQ